MRAEESLERDRVSDAVAALPPRLRAVVVLRDIYDLPKTTFVAEFIGETNLLPCTIAERSADALRLTSESGLTLSAQARSAQAATGPSDDARVQISIRPEVIRINDPGFTRPEQTSVPPAPRLD